MKPATISIYCKKCNTLLYKYHKHGPGKLVKCFVDRITKDYTKGDLTGPKCATEFARFSMVWRKPAHKIIQGEVLVKGHFGP
mgnify:FL=1